ncbi:hypothetical protein MIND_00168900 [Mycena indigotica]|uniref:Uncharacterized protein n=1 Tax=Mycena indigotica TaxID=2126181 RepID=A0A8H6TDB0_9AGAR|nr:uncharacterized protein MIND_00168900 [Mycena indigotica]KAF7316498.1 hypothetical protein MIND_00168900 [Mycena indigotica]
MPDRGYIPWDFHPMSDVHHLPPPYEAHRPPLMPLSDKKRPKLELRPLPTLPLLPIGSQASVTRPTHRRRASGGNFGTKPPLLVVCNRNENDSPISPDSPILLGRPRLILSPTSTHAFPDLSRLSKAVRAIPPTPKTPRFLVHSPEPMKESFTPITPGFRIRARPANAKRIARHGFGDGSVGDIPDSVLEELRALPDRSLLRGEGGDSSDSSSSGESDEEDFIAGYESDSMVEEAKKRGSLHWVHDFGEDERWMAESYSDILKAL